MKTKWLKTQAVGRWSRVAYALGVVVLSVGSALAAPPANDDFANRVGLSGLPATYSGSNVDATLQVNEPQPSDPGAAAASVWFRWVSPVTGHVVADTLGSDFDTVIAVWTGNGVTRLSELGSNDDRAGSHSSVRFPVTAGGVYRIAIYDAVGSGGNYQLNLDIASGITGTITGPNGVDPLEDLVVWAARWQDSAWQLFDVAASDASGDYSLGQLPLGTYRVFFSDVFFEMYAQEFYDDAPVLAGAQDLVLTGSTPLTGIDASLVVGAGIAGTVTGPDGSTPLPGIEVAAYRLTDDVWEWVNAEETDAQGAYAIGGLPAGTYRVEFTDVSEVYAGEVYDDVVEFGAGTDIPLAVGTQRNGVDASLVRSAMISGTVTGAAGEGPLAGLLVIVLLWDGVDEEVIASGTTGADGTYTIGGLAAHTVRIEFWDPSGMYATELYDDALVLNSAMALAIPPGGHLTGIDAELAIGGSISGSVTGPDGSTPLANIGVQAYRFSGTDWEQIFFETTGAAGTYTFLGLAAGTYRIEFYDEGGVYLGEAYDDAVIVEEGTDVVVVPGVDVTGIDASLATAAHITGTVSGTGGSPPLAGIEVTAFLQWRGAWVAIENGITDASGAYDIGGLPPGSFRIGFADNNGTYAAAFYDDVPDLASAMTIELSAGGTVGGVHAELAAYLTGEPARIMGLQPSGAGTFDVLFTGADGVSYQLEETPAFGQPWLPVGPLVVAQAGATPIPRPVSGDAGLWRVVRRVESER